MTDQTQEEQAAPVDWQAITRQRERELKTVGEARHRAEASVARVRVLADELFLAGKTEIERNTGRRLLTAIAEPAPGPSPAEVFVNTVADIIADHEGDEWEDHSATRAIRAAITRVYEPRPAATPAAETAECRASISGRCLRESQSETACDTDAGECVHGGQPAADEPDDTDQAEADIDRMMATGTPVQVFEASGSPWTADDRLKPHAIPAATVPDGPTITGGFDDSIEIPELDEDGHVRKPGPAAETAIRYAQAVARVESSGPKPAPAGPATVTDPAYLREQYAAVMLNVIAGPPPRILPPDTWQIIGDLAAAVHRVRDRHVEQLRQRLALADEARREDAEQRAEWEGTAYRHAKLWRQAQQQRDQYAGILREILDELVPGTVSGRIAFYMAEQPIAPWRVDHWRSVLDQPKERPDA